MSNCPSVFEEIISGQMGSSIPLRQLVDALFDGPFYCFCISCLFYWYCCCRDAFSLIDIVSHAYD